MSVPSVGSSPDSNPFDNSWFDRALARIDQFAKDHLSESAYKVASYVAPVAAVIVLGAAVVGLKVAVLSSQVAIGHWGLNFAGYRP